MVDVNVVGNSSSDHSSWLGGSIVAADPSFCDWVMTKESYEEQGPRIARPSFGLSTADLVM